MTHATDDLAPPTRRTPWRLALGLWRTWFLWRTRTLTGVPDPHGDPGAVVLRPVSGGPPAGHAILRFGPPDTPHHVRVSMVRADGAHRPLVDVPAIRPHEAVERVVVLPADLRALVAVAPDGDVGSIEVVELGRIPVTVRLVLRFLVRLRGRPASAWVGAGRRALRTLARGGSRGVLGRLTVSEHAAEAWGGDGRGRGASIRVVEARGDHRCAPEVVELYVRRAEASLDALLRDGGEISFAAPDGTPGGEVPDAPATPDVSIVVVTYGAAALAARCLEALARHRPPSSEVIVLDNDPSDRRVAALLDRLPGATVLRNTGNIGFGGACNQGVAVARGRYVLLLNSDAIVTPGAIDAAIACAEETGAEVVGGRVLGLDGVLLEAGSIVWDDGSCEAFGRGLHPDRTEFHHRRDVDFVSGVFLLSPRAVWNELGGLDRCFDPAYYEDVDYCMRVWAHGGTVRYEPRATVVHAEHGSGSVEGASALMRANRPVFVARHAAALERQLPRAPERRLLASVADRARPWVLVVDDRVPFADQGSGAPRMAAMVRALVEHGYRVTFYAKLVPDSARDVHENLPPDVEVIIGYGLERVAEALADRPGAFDAVIVSRVHNLIPLRRILGPDRHLLGGAAVIYDAESIGALRRQGRAALDVGAGHEEANPDLHPDLDGELELAAGVDAVLAVSPREAEAFREAGNPNVHVVSHAAPGVGRGAAHEGTGHAAAEAGSPPGVARSSVLFVGNLALPSLPNVDSLQWYGAEVAPALARRMARDGMDAPVLRAVGNASPEVRALLAMPGIELVGPVADLAPEYARARLFVAPTRFGAGIPLKVIDAVAHGVPTIVTPLLADQLGWEDGALVVADGAEAFASGIARLLHDDAHWLAVRDAGLDAVSRWHSADALATGLLGALDAVTAPAPLRTGRP